MSAIAAAADAGTGGAHARPVVIAHLPT